MGVTAKLPAIKKTMRSTFGIKGFRPGQEDVIRSVMEGRDTLAIMFYGRGQIALLPAPGAAPEGDDRHSLSADRADEGPGRKAPRARACGLAGQ